MKDNNLENSEEISNYNDNLNNTDNILSQTGQDKCNSISFILKYSKI